MQIIEINARGETEFNNFCVIICLLCLVTARAVSKVLNRYRDRARSGQWHIHAYMTW